MKQTECEFSSFSGIVSTESEFSSFSRIVSCTAEWAQCVVLYLIALLLW